MYFVYLLRCKDNSLYCGQTNNLERRVKEHSTSKSKSATYTKWRRPVVLVYFETLKTISEALKREHKIKRYSKLKKEKLISTLKEAKNMISPKRKKNGSD